MAALTRDELLAAASSGEVVLTLTGLGQAHEPVSPQPILWGEPARNGSWTRGTRSPVMGPAHLRLPQVAEGQKTGAFHFARMEVWITVSDSSDSGRQPGTQPDSRRNNSLLRMKAVLRTGMAGSP